MWNNNNGMLDQVHVLYKMQRVHAFKSNSTDNIGRGLNDIFLIFC